MNVTTQNVFVEYGGTSHPANYMAGATAAVLSAMLFVYLALNAPQDLQVEKEKSVEVAFVEKVVAPPPPPPPPPPKVEVAPPPPAPAVPQNLPKHIKKVVVKKLPVVKKVKVPVKMKKLKLAEADPSQDKVYVLEGAQVSNDPAAMYGASFADTKPLPPKAVPPKAFRGNAAPVYPADAKQAGLTDTVILKILVGTDGRVAVQQVIRGAEPFVAAAIEAVRTWRYTPAKENGQTISVYHIVKIPFKLRA